MLGGDPSSLLASDTSVTSLPVLASVTSSLIASDASLLSRGPAPVFGTFEYFFPVGESQVCEIFS